MFKKKNKKAFSLTIGGFGLTGIILTVSLQLKKIRSYYLDQKITEFNTYKEFYTVSKNVGNYEYSVSWIDNFSKYKFQGLNYLAKHSNIKKNNLFFYNDSQIRPISLLISKLIVKSYFFLRIFNIIYRNYKNKFKRFRKFFI